MDSKNSVLPFLINMIKLRNAGGLEHSDNTTIMAISISEKIGLEKMMKSQLEFAARVHDIGKVGIHESILTKAGRLTRNEFDAVKDHTLYGAEMLRLLQGLCTHEITDNVIQIVEQHHENFDGTGYLKGLKGNNIHIGARIIRIADTYTAMTTPYRVYRPSLNPSAAMRIMQDQKRMYDPVLLQAFFEVLDERIRNDQTK